MYKAEFNCSNCGEDSTIDIKKGTTVTKFLETGVCPNCGCKTLEQNKGEKDDIYKFEKMDPSRPYNPYHKDFHRDDILLPNKTDQKCLFDGLDPDKTYGISCPCPRCSPYSMESGNDNILKNINTSQNSYDGSVLKNTT